MTDAEVRMPSMDSRVYVEAAKYFAKSIVDLAKEQGISSLHLTFTRWGGSTSMEWKEPAQRATEVIKMDIILPRPPMTIKLEINIAPTTGDPPPQGS
jgi:hypothetical protein